MAKKRRRVAPGRVHPPKPPPVDAASIRAIGRPEQRGHPAKPRGREGLAPTLLWMAATFIGAVPVVALIAITVTQQHLPGTRWSLIGTFMLLGVIVLCFALKAAQALLNWKDPDPD